MNTGDNQNVMNRDDNEDDRENIRIKNWVSDVEEYCLSTGNNKDDNIMPLIKVCHHSDHVIS